MDAEGCCKILRDSEGLLKDSIQLLKELLGSKGFRRNLKNSEGDMMMKDSEEDSLKDSKEP